MHKPPDPEEPGTGRRDVLFGVAILILVAALVVVMVVALWWAS